MATRQRRSSPGNPSAHIAPPANRVASLVSDVLESQQSDTATHPAVKAAVVHYELEIIHPFEDGNGRIGRLWHTLILSGYPLVFLHVPIESVIRERQADYYTVLRACDQAGPSTAFVEFSLNATNDALTELAPSSVMPDQRLDAASEHFQTRTFSRKECLALFPGLSTASASRDLRKTVDENRVLKTGDKAQTVYRFVPG